MDCGRKPKKHANSMQKDQDANRGSSSCKATVLTTEPLYSPQMPL